MQKNASIKLIKSNFKWNEIIKNWDLIKFSAREQTGQSKKERGFIR